VNIHRSAWLLVAALSTITGCKKRNNAQSAGGSTGAGTGAPSQQSSQGGPGISGQEQGQSSVESVPPTPATGCPAQQPNAALGPGTIHRTDITTNETWTLEGSPHRFPHGATIHENVTVTVAPCAVVLLGDTTHLVVRTGGALIAVGDAQRPIRFGSNKNEPQPGDWHGLWFEERARQSTRLAYLTVEHGGAEGASGEAACIHSAMEGLDLQHVLVRNCRGFGVELAQSGTFSSTSTALTVRETVAGGRTSSGAVAFLNVNAVRTLPEGTYTGNEVNEIYIGGSNVLSTTGAWRNPGVRYRIADDLDLRVEGPSAPVLTLAPGTTVAFGSGASLSIGWDAEGALVADGTNEQHRITFTASATEPNPGAWEGIFIGERALRARTKLAWVNIAFAGGDSGWDGACAWSDEENDAALYLATPLAAESVTHVTFSGLPANTAAIARAWRAGPAVDYTATVLGNSFNNAGTSCKQSPVRVNESCPENARCP
jgi:hypothetical protein